MKEGGLGVKFSALQPVWANYDVLETDYTSYAVVHACSNFLFGLYKSELVWILTREKLAKSEIADIEKIGKSVLQREAPNYDTNQLRYTL